MVVFLEAQDSHCLTPERFRQWFYNLSPLSPLPKGPEAVAVLLDSCGWPAPTGGYYWMGFEAQHTVQLVNTVLFVDQQPVLHVDRPDTLWAGLESLFKKHQAGLSSDEQALLTDERLNQMPFISGWVGTLGYELNHWIEPSVPPRPNSGPFGELYLMQCKHRIGWHPASNTVWLASPEEAWLSKAMAALKTTVEPKGQRIIEEATSLHAYQAPIHQSLLPQQYEAQVAKVLDHIGQGDIYQANLSIRFYKPEVPLSADLTLYQTLVERNPSPFSGLMQTPVGTLIANSPERLIRYNPQDGRLDTRPIAGTRGRGQTDAEQTQINETLLGDPKEHAEHLMLLDLERNDLGRVAQGGSVHVPDPFVLEQYAHVTHIVSQVEGLLDMAYNRWDVLRALFPGGTITGCPKVSCMDILHRLEPVPRGLYTGSLGYLDFRGHLDFNILIRSLFHWPDERLFFHAGAGIVADSVPSHEYRECLRKTQAIVNLFTPELTATDFQAETTSRESPYANAH